MIKVPLTYRSLEGKEVTKDFYFNLNQGEVAEINFELDGGLQGFIEKMQDEPEVKDVIKVFKELILKSYGRRLVDGRFGKSEADTMSFAASDAYSVLFLKFLENDNDFVTKFLEGAMNVPLEEVKKQLEEKEKATGVAGIPEIADEI